MPTPKLKRVTILQHRLLHYRVDFFEYLRKTLLQHKVELELIHGQASAIEKTRNDEGKLSWATQISNHFFRVGGVDLIWQSLPHSAKNTDLLIIMQENRILSNYPLIIKRRINQQKIAYWGHGKNFQSNAPDGLKEKWKKYWLNRVDWWFAYTQTSVDLLLENGYPKTQISCLNNAIDSKQFKQQLNSCTEQQLVALKEQLLLKEDTPIALYCGSLYKEKRLELMLDAADLIQHRIPDFTLIIIGDGPEKTMLEQAALTRPWLKIVGIKKNQQKALYFKLSSLILNPGLVGLHILDALCAGKPIITTDDALHSPEFEYLEHNKNGLILKGNANSYANGIIDLIANPTKYQMLCNQAKKDADNYTIEQMGDNFCQGILQCLKL